MVSAGVGLAARGKVPFLDTFACFLSRAYDQVRMAAISRSNINLCGSHCGVSIGEDGPSQMALEDIAMFRAVHSSTVLYPSDAISAERLTEAMARRARYQLSANDPAENSDPVLKGREVPDPRLQSAPAEPTRSSDRDRRGNHLHEALKAADQLKAEGTAVRVIDLYCVKPIDGKALAKEIAATGGRLITVEDHWAEGGIGEAVLSALAQAGVARRSRDFCGAGDAALRQARMNWLMPSAFRQGTLLMRCARFYSKPGGAPIRPRPFESTQSGKSLGPSYRWRKKAW